MRKLLLTTACVLAATIGQPALASDYNDGVVTKTPGGGHTPVEFGSGWYLRGDITFNVQGKQEISIASEPFNGAVEAEYEDVVGFKIGGGYQFNPNFRVDFTAEQTLNSDFMGVFETGLPGLETQVAPTGLTSVVPINNVFGLETVQADYDTTSLLANGYFDFTKIGRFTPYVGAGIGVTRVAYSELRTATCIPDAAQSCAGAFGGSGEGVVVEDVVLSSVDEEFYEFTYQLAVGTAYDISDTLKLDVGYSYNSIGGGSEIEYSDGTAVDIDGFSTHKINVGLRYELW